MELLAVNLPELEMAYTNMAYVHPKTLKELGSSGEPIRCQLNFKVVLDIGVTDLVQTGQIAISKGIRKYSRIGLTEAIEVKIFKEKPLPIKNLTITGRPLKSSIGSIKDVELTQAIYNNFKNHVFQTGQTFVIRLPDSSILECRLEEGSMFDMNDRGCNMGTITDTTNIEYYFDSKLGFTVRASQINTNKLFDANFNFEALGIGGLDREFQEIFRRAFASRVYPAEVMAQFNITHVKGMILFGPPGTGKTLIARQISKALKSVEPKVVNGPEVLNKYVGQSEENIRQLFKEAEEDMASKGDNSPLHIIIFDELDAICKVRGSNPSGAGVNDSVVNQLLSKIDGVDALNNVLIIGMTNRLDMIDEALLRPGRFEVHIEIGLPDEPGREQIFRIHTKSMKDAKRMEDNVNVSHLAQVTKNYSGAEISGVCRSAVSFALNRNINHGDLTKPTDPDLVKVGMADFQAALDEVKPCFGADESTFEARLKHDIVIFSKECSALLQSLQILVKEAIHTNDASIMSALLTGEPASGKTAIASHIAIQSQFPFAKMISPDDMVGYTEYAKVNHINKIFNDAYKSSLSLIVIDEVETLCDYVPIGPRFSNIVLQAILVLCRKIPKADGRRIIVIATSSRPEFMDDVGLTNAFQVVKKVPCIKTANQLKRILAAAKIPEGEQDRITRSVETICETTGDAIGIKRIYQAIDIARELADPISHSAFMQGLNSVGIV